MKTFNIKSLEGLPTEGDSITIHYDDCSGMPMKEIIEPGHMIIGYKCTGERFGIFNTPLSHKLKIIKDEDIDRMSIEWNAKIGF